MSTSRPVQVIQRADEEYTASLPSAGSTAGQLTTDQAPAPADTQTTTSAAYGPVGLPPRAGRCLLIEEIGRGGMGVVLRAIDPFFGRHLAVKILLAGDDRPDLARRFLDEARLTGRLQHPGIPPVHEQGMLDDRRPYFTMKLIEGRTLDALLKERPAPLHDLPRFVAIFEQVCHTVAYAHSQGVIHRDLKPHNVMVGAFGEVQVMDWGLAKDVRGAAHGAPDDELEVGGEEAASTPHFFATQAGQALGTPAYMAPEQARGVQADLDERADVFGLGAILCTILTGRPPFQGASAADALERARQANLSGAWERLAGCGADPELVRIARDCLEPQPAARPRDAAAVVGAVTAYLTGVAERLKAAEIGRAAAQSRAQAERGKRRRTAALALTVLATVVLAAGAWVWLQQRQQARRDQTAQQANQSLGRAKLLRDQAAAEAVTDLEGWRKVEMLRRDALAAAEQAERAVLAGEPDAQTRRAVEELLPKVRAEAEEITRDRAMVEKLNKGVRSDEESVTDDDFDHYVATRGNDDRTIRAQADGNSYAKMFREYGIDVVALPEEEAALVIAQCPIRKELVSGLETWLTRIDPGPLRDKLLRITRAAEPDDPSRDRLWSALSRQDLDDLERLASSPEALRMPTSSVLLLADGLYQKDRVTPAIALLRRAQRLDSAKTYNGKLAEYLQYSGGTEPPQRLEVVRFYTASEATGAGKGGNRAVLADALSFAGAFEEAEARYRQALDEQPNLAWVRNKLAANLAAQGRHAEALEEVRRAVDLRPQSAFIYEGYGGVCYTAGRYEDAATAYRKAISIRPHVGSYHSGLGQALIELGLSKEALAEHEEAIRLKPTAQSYANQAFTLVKVGRAREAIEVARTAIRVQPGSPVGRSALANALAADGQHSRAAEVYREIIAWTPNDAGLWHRLGTVLRQQGKNEEARHAIQEAIRCGPRQGSRLASFYNDLGLIHTDLKHTDEAVATFRKAAKANPADAIIRENLGDALREQGSLKDAAEVFREAVRLKPEWSDPRRKLAEVLDREGHLDEALAVLKEARPENADVFYYRVRLYQDHGRHQEAMEVLGPWLKSRPDDGPALHRLGVSLEKTGRLEEALAAYEKALTGRASLRMDYAQASLDFGNALLERGRRLDKDDPVKARAATARGHAYHAWGLNRLGRKTAAAEKAREAVALNTKEAKYHRLLGACLRESQPESALAAYHAALELDRTSFDDQRAVAELLSDLDRPDEALKAWQAILKRDIQDERAHRAIGRILLETGRLEEALVHFEKGRDEAAMKQCKRFEELAPALASFVQAKTRPREDELLDVAELCRSKDMPAAAARFYAEALKAKVLKPGTQESHRAASSAASAGCGEHDAADLAESQKTALRKAALERLRDELAEATKSLAGASPGVAAATAKNLTRWQHETALEGVRDPEALLALPDAECSGWEAFWAEVESVRQLAVRKMN